MKILCGLLTALLITTSYQARGHGVHDSGHASPQKGGILRSLESIHLELVTIDDEIKIFIYDKSDQLKPLDPKKYPASAEVVLPRKKGSEKLDLKQESDHWSAKYKAKDTHRYDLKFHIEQAGHKDTVTYTIEPKR